MTADVTLKWKRNLILFTACISTFMATLDASIVNITLPVLSEYFSVHISSIQWIVTAYLLTISTLLLIWGKISDIIGRKVLFAAGLAVFTLGSLFCGLSNSFPMLILSRVLQAVGASITMALVQGIVTSIFPAGERGKALGIVGTVVAIGSLVGPSLGGILVHVAGWRSIFFINIPFGLIGMVLALILMKESGFESGRTSFDYKGSVVFVFSISLLFIGLLTLQDGMLPPAWAYTMLLLAVFLIVFFIRYEKKQKNPLLEISLFKNLVFTFSLASAYLSYLSMFAYIFLMPFYLQYALEMDVLDAGLIMSIYPLTTGILAPISGWLSDRKSHIPLPFIGLVINTLALALLSLLDADSSMVQIGLLIAMLGFGSAMFQSPNTSTIMGSVSRNKLGVAGSINAFFRNFGMISGTTLAVMLFILVTKTGINNLTNGVFNTPLFLQGFRAVLLGASLFSFIGAVLSAYRSMKSRNASGFVSPDK